MSSKNAPLNEKATAIEITSREIWDILCALDPHMNELSFEENLGSFLIVNSKKSGRWALATPTTIATHFERIEKPGPTIPTAYIVG